MTSRADIAPDDNGFRRLSYTCRCGWIDWGHANGTGAAALIARIGTELNASPADSDSNIFLNGNRAFVLEYTQRMGNRHLMVPLNDRLWIVRKGMNLSDRLATALAIFKTESLAFEGFQGNLVWGNITDSGFSAEDLVSNLVGFFRAVSGKTEAQMRTLCGDVGETESLAIWDSQVPNGLGAFKNTTFNPIYFRSDTCNGIPQAMPVEIASMHVAAKGLNWTSPFLHSVPDGTGWGLLRYDFDSSGSFSVSFN